jgi:hypothetical protein
MFRRWLDPGLANAGIDVGEYFGSPAGRDLFRHRRRDCAWDEADECLRLGYMTPDQHARVTAHFTAQALPRHAGLYVNTCLVQRMGCARTDALNAAMISQSDQPDPMGSGDAAVAIG